MLMSETINPENQAGSSSLTELECDERSVLVSGIGGGGGVGPALSSMSMVA